LKLEADAVAKFLSQYSEQLDKTQIGDYIGGEKDFNVSVLHAYIDRIDLGGMEYDEAIRSFLTGFRLPGEAQKIDRIMEKFAARYLDCNAGKFANADTAFILGYAIIMLQTDLHNPNIKPEKKMTADTFARQNRGIDDGKDLPRDFLDGIYRRIKENPFTLREDDLAREQKEKKEGKISRGLFFDENRHRAKKFAKESQKMAQQSMAVLRGAIGEGDERRYCKITNNRDHIRPMFEIAWEPMLAVFSVLMERMLLSYSLLCSLLLSLSLSLSLSLFLSLSLSPPLSYSLHL
jgi:brefeldin A-inhibited guanine nucleotide-exchange protein